MRIMYNITAVKPVNKSMKKACMKKILKGKMLKSKKIIKKIKRAKKA